MFCLFLVAVAVWLLSRLFPTTGKGLVTPERQGDRAISSVALDILHQGYAMGETSKAEYEEMAAVVKS